MTFFLVAGEASGDARGAELMAALREVRPGCRFAGLGGPKMRALGGEGIEDWIEKAAVIGIVDVLRNYPFFRRYLSKTRDTIVSTRPDAVVLIDYPGFNLRLADAVKRRDARIRVIDYISPQVWAWNTGRIRSMAGYLDKVLCIFPFEEGLYRASGLSAEFVGHPIVDALGPLRSGADRDPHLVALLPGSRSKEIHKIFPPMLGAAERMKRECPELRFIAGAASEAAAEKLRGIASGFSGVGCEIGVGTAHSLMVRAAVGMVASGTATLEAAFLGLPHVLVYRVAWITYEIGRRVIRVPHLGIINILAGREVVREFVQQDAEPGSMAAATMALLHDEVARAQHLNGVASAVRMLGEPGAAMRAAGAIVAVAG